MSHSPADQPRNDNVPGNGHHAAPPGAFGRREPLESWRPYKARPAPMEPA